MEEFIKSVDVHHKVLEMLGTEDYQRMLSSTYGADNKDFRAGAMFGSAVSAMYVTAHADKYSPTMFCRCKGCMFRDGGHPDKPWLPCREMDDNDFCSYGFPTINEGGDNNERSR